MTHPNKAKGDAFERDVRAHLTETFGRFRVVRPHQEGYKDVGDLHIDPWVLQLKNVTRIDLASFVADAETQRANAGGTYAAAVVKRRQRPVGSSYVVMTLDTFRAMLADHRQGRGTVGAPSTEEDS